MERTLPEDELIRASQFQHLQARQRYVCGRLILRGLLANVLQQTPRDIMIVRSAGGKPSLVRTGGASIEFSLSHCSGGLAIALSSQVVGVDIEAAEPRNWQRVAARYFSSREQAWIKASEDPGAAFRTLWTAKESLVKLVDGSLPAILRVDCLAAPNGADLVQGRQVSVLTFALACGTCCSLARHVDQPESTARSSIAVFNLQDDHWRIMNLKAVSQNSLIMPAS